MMFIHSDNVNQEVLSAAFDLKLRHAVLLGTLEGRADRAYPQGSNGPGNLQPIFRVSIEDQKPGSGPAWKRLPQRLDDPTTRGMFRDVDMQDPSPIVADDEQATEHAERDRWNREEIHCGNGFPMVSKEGEPSFGQLGIPRRPFYPT